MAKRGKSALAIATQEPIIETHEPQYEKRADVRFWPEKAKLPQVYRKPRRELLPCEKCRRVYLDDLKQAVECRSSGGDIAWFRCKACGHTWKLPVERT